MQRVGLVEIARRSVGGFRSGATSREYYLEMKCRMFAGRIGVKKAITNTSRDIISFLCLFWRLSRSNMHV